MMQHIPLTYLPGTQKSTQQTEVSMLCFSDTDKVHFPDGRLTTLPPYAAAAASSDYVDLLGAVRSIWASKFTGTNAGTYYLAGSNTRLYAISQGTLYNITPFAGQKQESLGDDPLDVTSGDATLTINWTSHGLAVGDLIQLINAIDVGGVDAPTYINTAFLVDTVPDANSVTVEMGTNASSTAAGGGYNIIAYAIEADATLGTDPLSVTNTSETVTVTQTAHGFAVGDRIKIFGVNGAVGGIPAAQLNDEHIVTAAPNANTFTFEAGAAATSTTSGGGSSVTVFAPIASGNLDQQAATGYGTGLSGEGLYGAGGPAVTAQEFPRIWSFADFGANVVMCPGDYTSGDGQKIYLWDGDLNKAPTVLANAPTDCNWVDVVNNHIVALCNKRIDIAAIGSTSDWTGLSSYTQEIQSVSRLVSSQVLNEKEGCIFTPNLVLRIRFVGGQDIWDISDLFLDDGIVGPNAKCVLNSKVYWRGARGAYEHSGNIPVRIKNTQNDEWIRDNLNFGKAWKCFAFAAPEYSEWYFYFPTGTDSEPTDYMIHNVIGFDGLPSGSFTLGEMTRTAAQKPGPLDSQFYMINSASEAEEGTPFLHFNGGAVTFSWSATTAEQNITQRQSRIMLQQFMPDSNQNGTCNIAINTREYPQGALSATSAYTFTGADDYITVKAAGKQFGFTFSGSSQFTIGAWTVGAVNLFARRS